MEEQTEKKEVPETKKPIEEKNIPIRSSLFLGLVVLILCFGIAGIILTFSNNPKPLMNQTENVTNESVLNDYYNNSTMIIDNENEILNMTTNSIYTLLINTTSGTDVNKTGTNNTSNTEETKTNSELNQELKDAGGFFAYRHKKTAEGANTS